MPHLRSPAPGLAALVLLCTLVTACGGTRESLPPRSTYDEHGLHVVAHPLKSCSICRIYDESKGFVVRIVSSTGIGAGVVLTDQGLAVTNAHVVGTARSVDVEASNGRTYVGRVIAVQGADDLAVVQVEAPNRIWPTPGMHTGNPHPVGTDVFIIGYPLGIGWTVTRGVISGYKRIDERTLIRTDATVSPGMSGSALLDVNGALIGIVTERRDDGGTGDQAYARPTSALLAFVRTIQMAPTLDDH